MNRHTGHQYGDIDAGYEVTAYDIDTAEYTAYNEGEEAGYSRGRLAAANALLRWLQAEPRTAANVQFGTANPLRKVAAEIERLLGNKQ